MKPDASLRKRLVVLFFIADLLLIISFALGTYIYIHRRLIDSFDAALRANAEALATLVSVEDDGAIELEFSDEVMSRFSKTNHPDVFAIARSNGQLIEKSKSLQALPSWFSPRRAIAWQDFSLQDNTYRGIILPTVANADEDDEAASRTPIVVMFATSREQLDSELRNAFQFLIIGALLVIVLSVGAAYWVVAKGLSPLMRLANETVLINSQTLGHRFDNAGVPRDLHPFADAFNNLLARLESAFDRERQFSADAAHELRTPVAMLKSEIQATLLSPPDSAKDREALAELLEDIVRLESLCESLLWTAKSDVPSDGMSDQSIGHFAESVQRIVDAFSGRAAQTGKSVQIRISDLGTHSVRANTETTHRIIGNLLENALLHGGHNILVELTQIESSLVVAISDDGAGIPETLRPRLFQRFARGDSSRSRTTGGAGLGLAISRSLVEREGGSLMLDTACDRGARFLWRLPFCDAL